MQLQQFFGNDLILNSQGDLMVSDGDELTNELIVRRLLTNPGTYIWHPKYGAGIGRFIGEALSSSNFDYIKTIIISNIFMESGVSQFPSPQIDFTPLGNNILQCDIFYTSALTKNPVSVSFPVNY